ncbi:hypothetical protein SAMN05444366_3875 [Flavobacterium saccharophilum]|uniref:Uncharacterized protein n=1 Tax=Flavobacterium saccharophilum TaxID=29534 RepID=A0A1M7L099_9FLAO|nr:hypothetical protein SAMN05444366_3875 [Flavobacterium saccharophilum]
MEEIINKIAQDKLDFKIGVQQLLPYNLDELFVTLA